MKVAKILFLLPVFFINSSYGSDACEYGYVVSDLRQNCTGINAELQEIKTYGTVNTIVTGAGTVAAGGALYAGIKKKDIDKKAEELEKKMENIKNMSDSEFVGFLKEMAQYQELKEQYDSMCQMKNDYEAKSKKLGNVRTGLMAGNTATAVAGTIISVKNRKDSDSIKDTIQQCLDTIKKHEQRIGQAMIDCNRNQYEKLKKAALECKALSTENMEKVSNKNKVSSIVSGVNIGTGAAGTIVSAVANSNKVRDDNSEQGKQKEKNLNTAANVLAGTSAVASGVATVFNATTLKSINENLRVSEACEMAISRL